MNKTCKYALEYIMTKNMLTWMILKIHTWNNVQLLFAKELFSQLHPALVTIFQDS